MVSGRNILTNLLVNYSFMTAPIATSVQHKVTESVANSHFATTLEQVHTMKHNKLEDVQTTTAVIPKPVSLPSCTETDDKGTSYEDNSHRGVWDDATAVILSSTRDRHHPLASHMNRARMILSWIWKVNPYVTNTGGSSLSTLPRNRMSRNPSVSSTEKTYKIHSKSFGWWMIAFARPSKSTITDLQTSRRSRRMMLHTGLQVGESIAGASEIKLARRIWPNSMLTFLSAFELTCDTNGIYEGAAM